MYALGTHGRFDGLQWGLIFGPTASAGLVGAIYGRRILDIRMTFIGRSPQWAGALAGAWSYGILVVLIAVSILFTEDGPAPIKNVFSFLWAGTFFSVFGVPIAAGIGSFTGWSLHWIAHGGYREDYCGAGDGE